MSRYAPSAVAGVIASLLVVGVGCPNRARGPGIAAELTAAPGSGAAAGILGALDLVWVRVFDEPELTNEYQVEVDGTLDVPLIGPVAVAGLTPRQAADQIEFALADGYIQRPVVTVMVKESRSRQVFVLGEVQSPGSLLYVDGMTLVQAIAMAGGLTDEAAGNRTRLTRIGGEDTETLLVPFADISHGRAPNVALQPDDVITVPSSPI
jgi:protein involved in polysaccharide export with SLBB domain